MKIKILAIFTFIISISSSLPSIASETIWVSTTANNPWQVRNEITTIPFTAEILNDAIITSYGEQTMEGFGTCLNELGWDALNHLSQKDNEALMEELFHPEKGVRLGYCRLSIGGNDYSRNWYSYNETEGDFEMVNFCIDRDYEALIPYIKAVKKINPGLRLWASPWSPPTWMKTNRHYATQKGDYNDLDENNQVLAGDHFIQEPRYLSAYALYLSKYMNAYNKEGIDIEMLQFQNEPYTRNQWPTCLWTPESMRNFIANYLGPKFSAEHPDVELWFGTFNSNSIEDLNHVMQDPEVLKYIHGIGLQWEGKEIADKVSELYPDMKLMQTENECGGGTFDWPAAEHTFDLLKTYIDGGVGSYMYWNAVLADKGTSTWGWNQNAMVVIDSKTGEITYTPEFYLMKHLSHYVDPGAVKLKTMGKDENMLAFRNPKGETVMLLVNKSHKPKQMKIGVKEEVLTFTLDPKSFNTIIYKA